MAFESIRKSDFVRKISNHNQSFLSLIITRGTPLKNGELTYSCSFRLSSELLKQMNWNEKTRLDVLVDRENHLGMLKVEPLGFAISFPGTNTSFMNGFVKFRVTDDFDYIPKNSLRMNLDIVNYHKDSIVFRMPNINNEPVLPVKNNSMKNNQIEHLFQLQSA